jgi:outer membrane receptor protein involved in Fe transport
MQTQILDDTNKPVLTPKQLNGLVDVNLEGEYRYSKMLSFFARVNNIANQRYYSWERYPTQRFNFMIGLTFVPF